MSSNVQKRKLASTMTAYDRALQHVNAAISVEAGVILLVWDSDGMYQGTNANNPELIGVLETFLDGLKQAEGAMPIEPVPLSDIPPDLAINGEAAYHEHREAPGNGVDTPHGKWFPCKICSDPASCSAASLCYANSNA